MTLDTVTAARLEGANAECQARFRAMLDAKTYGDPDAPETRAYVSAERTLDALIADAQWGSVNAALDAAFAGDHFVRTAP